MFSISTMNPSPLGQSCNTEQLKLKAKKTKHGKKVAGKKRLQISCRSTPQAWPWYEFFSKENVSRSVTSAFSQSLAENVYNTTPYRSPSSSSWVTSGYWKKASFSGVLGSDPQPGLRLVISVSGEERAKDASALWWMP